MMPLTKTPLKVIVIFSLLLLSGVHGYFTTNKIEIKPINKKVDIKTELVASEPSIDSKNPPTAGKLNVISTTMVATLTPFLDVIPSSDGEDLFIKIGGVDELGGTVYANVYDYEDGPTGLKGSYTMTFSNTTYTVQTVGLGLSPTNSEDGTIGITTTLGSNTDQVEFNRAPVPASSQPTIPSVDRTLELELRNTDTITFDTFIAVTRSLATPGPLPTGDLLIGSPYSVRASGALLTTVKPMLLRLSYEGDFPFGVDPHTLAIFAWDPNPADAHWNNIGGALLRQERRVSVATNRFTTYALVATTTWRDGFDLFSCLDLIQCNGVTIGGPLEDRALVLANTPGSGTAISPPITPTAAIASWGSLIFTPTVNSPTTTLTIDVLSLEGNEVLTNVASGTNLADLVGPIQYPSLRLRVSMTSTVSGKTPSLSAWQLSWQVEEQKIYLPVVLK